MALIYAGGLTDTSFTSGGTDQGWQPWNFIYGGHFVLASSGSATQMGVYCRTNDGVTTRNLKFGLYNSSGTLQAQSTATVTALTNAWVDSGAISASLAAGTYYILISSDGDAGTFVSYGYSSSGAGSFATETYATAMAASETITGQGEANQLYGVRMDFTTGGGGTSISLPSTGGATTSTGARGVYVINHSVSL